MNRKMEEKMEASWGLPAAIAGGPAAAAEVLLQEEIAALVSRLTSYDDRLAVGAADDMPGYGRFSHHHRHHLQLDAKMEDPTQGTTTGRDEADDVFGYEGDEHSLHHYHIYQHLRNEALHDRPSQIQPRSSPKALGAGELLLEKLKALLALHGQAIEAERRAAREREDRMAATIDRLQGLLHDLTVRCYASLTRSSRRKEIRKEIRKK